MSKLSIVEASSFLLDTKNFNCRECIEYLSSINQHTSLKNVGIHYFLDKMNSSQLAELVFDWDIIESEKLQQIILRNFARNNHAIFKRTLNEISYSKLSINMKRFICSMISEYKILSIDILRSLLSDKNHDIVLGIIYANSWTRDKKINDALINYFYVSENKSIKACIFKQLKQKKLTTLKMKKSYEKTNKNKSMRKQ